LNYSRFASIHAPTVAEFQVNLCPDTPANLTRKRQTEYNFAVSDREAR